MLFYLLLCWQLLYRHKKTIYQLAADADRRNLRWLKLTLAAITTMLAFLIFTSLTGYFLDTHADPGFSATLIISPANNFGITVLCNGMYPKNIVWNKIPFEIINLFGSEWNKGQ